MRIHFFMRASPGSGPRAARPARTASRRSWQRALPYTKHFLSLSVLHHTAPGIRTVYTGADVSIHTRSVYSANSAGWRRRSMHQQRCCRTPYPSVGYGSYAARVVRRPRPNTRPGVLFWGLRPQTPMARATRSVGTPPPPTRRVPPSPKA
jgi:hypothetical protein